MEAGFPSDWVTRRAHLVAPDGAVLDVASGRGCHARWFAARGCRVLALDRDDEALASMSAHEGIDTLTADLETGAPWLLEADRSFDAVIVTNCSMPCVAVCA